MKNENKNKNENKKDKTNLKKTAIKYLGILNKISNNDYEVHRNNLIKKLENTITENKSASFKTSEDIQKFIDPYLIYRKNIYSILKDLNQNNLDEKQSLIIKELNNYKDIAYIINNPNGNNSSQYFSAQSKYEPTIMEEFIGIFLSPLIKDLKDVKCGPVKAFCEMCLNISIDDIGNPIVKYDPKTKNQDFCLYVEKIIDPDTTLQIPLVSIECKTYIDKTMLEGSINTANRIKKGNPMSKFYMVSETWDLAHDEELNPNDLDNIFVIRKCKRRDDNDIDPNVLKDIYKTVQNDIQNMYKKEKALHNIISSGKLKP